MSVAVTEYVYVPTTDGFTLIVDPIPVTGIIDGPVQV
jgi:hypothetical protein